MDAIDASTIEYQAIEQIKSVYDPEIPVNIWELGLVYGIEVSPEGVVKVTMTLTSPMCPSAQEIPIEIEQKIKTIPGVTDCKTEIVWEPMWTKDMMSDTAKLRLGFF